MPFPLPIIAAAAFACLSPVAVDGDTVRCAGRANVRLTGIDAPEMPGHCRRGRACTPGNPWRARAALRQLLHAGLITCTTTGYDHYARTLAICINRHRVNLNCQMIRTGHAVARYTRIACPR